MSVISPCCIIFFSYYIDWISHPSVVFCRINLNVFIYSVEVGVNWVPCIMKFPELSLINNKETEQKGQTRVNWDLAYNTIREAFLFLHVSEQALFNCIQCYGYSLKRGNPRSQTRDCLHIFHLQVIGDEINCDNESRKQSQQHILQRGSFYLSGTWLLILSTPFSLIFGVFLISQMENGILPEVLGSSKKLHQAEEG